MWVEVGVETEIVEAEVEAEIVEARAGVEIVSAFRWERWMGQRGLNSDEDSEEVDTLEGAHLCHDIRGGA